MTWDPSTDPLLEHELTPLRTAVEGLRRGLEISVPSVPVAPDAPGLAAVRPTFDRVMAELDPLGFEILGDVGQQVEGKPPAYSRWFRHRDGTTCGWTGIASSRSGERLIVYLFSEVPGQGYCATGRGGSRLTLAKPPGGDSVVLDADVSLGELVAEHVRRAPAAGSLSTVRTLQEAFDLLDRLREFRIAWRATLSDAELWRADLREVLLHQRTTTEPDDFALIYSRAARWLRVPLPPLPDFLTALREGRTPYLRIPSYEEAVARRQQPPPPGALAHNTPDANALSAITSRIATLFRDEAGFRRLPHRMQLLYVLSFILDSEMLNGGVEQFLSNSSGDLAEECRGCLREIGAADVLAGLAQVERYFPGGRFPADRDERNRCMGEAESGDTEGWSAACEAADTAYLAACPGFYARLMDFVEAHGADFAEPPGDA